MSLRLTFCSHSPVPERHHKDTVLRAPAIPADVTNEATDGFGPLKTTLGVVSATYTDHGVRLRPPV